ncbi:PIN domain-containing protein [Halofilum ochraceum]|uniref:PIN domain-containing protein n=1 Tax=Halofilum ochraceum TaxID=1611323 RepID=UPI00082B8E91|nr:PIN domain-containing protein [Halofilum ochraceum]
MTFERSYIFLDTSVYVQESYRFSGTSLGKLAGMSSDDELRLIVPEIIQKEVTYKLRETAEEHAAKIQTALDSNIIGLIGEKDKKMAGLDFQIDQEMLVARIVETWERFCTRCNAEAIPLASVNLQGVVASYFDAKPPFGKGRKRNEFPDAFAVASMVSFAENNPRRPIYVVSRDNGMLEAFRNDSRFRCHKELSEVLDEYNRHTEALSPAAHALMEKNVDWITEVIGDELHANPSLYASEYRDGRVSVQDISVDVYEMNLVEIGLDRAVFDVGLDYRVYAEVIDMVRVGYDDYDWDVIPRNFDGRMTVYVEVRANSDFSELNEIASIEF